MKAFILVFCFFSLITSPAHSLFRIKRFHIDALKLHNYVRFLHDSTPFSLSVSLCDRANKSAEVILEQMQLGTEFAKLKKSVAKAAEEKLSYFEMTGENGWTKTVNASDNYEDDIDEDGSEAVIEAISNWYSEVKEYKWTNETFPKEKQAEYFDSIQGFAQLVWKTTFEVGCGNARDSTRIVIVCCYHPMAILTGFNFMKIHVPKRIRSLLFSVQEFNASDDQVPAAPPAGEAATVQGRSEKQKEELDYEWMGDIVKSPTKER